MWTNPYSPASLSSTRRPFTGRCMEQAIVHTTDDEVAVVPIRDAPLGVEMALVSYRAFVYLYF